MGGNLANVCREILLVFDADMSIAGVKERSIGVDVSITKGILMLVWRETYRMCVASFYLSSPLS